MTTWDLDARVTAASAAQGSLGAIKNKSGLEPVEAEKVLSRFWYQAFSKDQLQRHLQQFSQGEPA